MTEFLEPTTHVRTDWEWAAVAQRLERATDNRVEVKYPTQGVNV